MIDLLIEPRTILTRRRFSTWMACALVSPTFDISDDLTPYEHLLELDAACPDVLPAVATLNEYRFHPVSEMVCDDPAFVVLRRRDVVGFYLGPAVYVVPNHRGQRLGAAVIVAAAQHEGVPRIKVAEPLGFSPSGHAAHRDAWELEEMLLADRIPTRSAA